MSKKCMYARSKYNYTPSDYDLIFDYTKIPSNINMEDAVYAFVKNNTLELEH